MGNRAMDDLERTLQRLGLMERRLARLETLVREKVGNLPEPEESITTADKPRFLDQAMGCLQFPEIRPQLADPPAPARSRDSDCKAVRVRAAVEQFEHLLAPLSTLWGHPEFDRYINRLIVDDRGSRRGFGPRVMEELLFLAELNHFICPTWHPCDPWEDSQFIGDRL